MCHRCWPLHDECCWLCAYVWRYPLPENGRDDAGPPVAGGDQEVELGTGALTIPGYTTETEMHMPTAKENMKRELARPPHGKRMRRVKGAEQATMLRRKSRMVAAAASDDLDITHEAAGTSGWIICEDGGTDLPLSKVGCVPKGCSPSAPMVSTTTMAKVQCTPNVKGVLTSSAAERLLANARPGARQRSFPSVLLEDT